MSLSWLALGDSYTIGEGIEENGRWPVQLSAMLRDASIDIAPPRIIARTGWTTDELAAAMDAAEPLGDQDLVSLLIGVNNQYRGRSVEEYREQFSALLQRAITYARDNAKRAFVLSIPDWGITPFAIAQQRDAAQIARAIDAFNAAAKEICDARGVAFIDITPLSRERGSECGMLADDGLHPSAAMYAGWAALALPFVRAARL